MKCLECHEEMRSEMIGNVSIDECMGCKSIWFDVDEFDKVKDELDPDLRWMDFDLWKHQAHFRVGEDLILCPKCRKSTMSIIHYDNTDVDIKYCPLCRGMWFDSVDFGKIISALEREAEEKGLSEYVKASLKEAADIIKDPENMVSEWKDFVTVMRMLKYRLFVENPKLEKVLLGIQQSLPL